MAARIRIGVIGAGSMGSRHARIVAAHPDTELAVVVEPSAARRAAVAAAHVGVATSLASLTTCDAVIVATPTSTHHEVALMLLQHGIAVLVEKPATATAEELRSLLDTAEAGDVPLMCGFVERFNPAWLAGSAMCTAPPTRFRSTRRSPPVPRAEGHVAIDLLVHDIDLAVLCFGTDPAPTATPIQRHGAVTDHASVGLEWLTGEVALCTASRVAEHAERRLVVDTLAEQVEMDLLAGTVDVHRAGRSERMAVAVVQEPLAAQFDRFLALVAGRLDPAAERTTIQVVHDIAFDVAHLPHRVLG